MSVRILTEWRCACGGAAGLTEWQSMLFLAIVDLEVNAPRCQVSQEVRLARSKTTERRAETVALLITIRAGQKQVEHRIRQTRALMMSQGLGRNAKDSLLTQQPDPGRLDSPTSPSDWHPQPSPNAKCVRILIRQISSEKFLSHHGLWTNEFIEAGDFKTVFQALLFALEHLTIPIGVYCAFDDPQYDFSIALISPDLSAASHWDIRVNEMVRGINVEKTQPSLISDRETDQFQALRYLPGRLP
jgi:hypothetical protein